MSKSYPEAAVFHSEVRSLVSSIIGQEFQIPVWLPPSYAESERTYPILYLLDANVNFGMAADAVTLLLFGPEIPEIIVAGIGYPIRSYDDWGANRARDLTPTAMDETPGSGGADKFLSFIRTELIPFVETEYRADSDDRAISGYSLGGLFVLYALFSQPRLFRRYAAGSPSVNWDGQFLVKFEAEYAARHRALPARLFISVGSLEENASALESTNSIKSVEAILRARNYEGFHHEFLVLDGETHLSGVAPALVRGVKSMFASNLAR